MSFFDGIFDFIGDNAGKIIGTAASFIPGVGPVLGAALSAGGGLVDSFSNMDQPGDFSSEGSAGYSGGYFEYNGSGYVDEYGNDVDPYSDFGSNTGFGNADALSFAQSSAASPSFLDSLSSTIGKGISAIPSTVGDAVKSAFSGSGLLNAGVSAFGSQQAAEAQRETNAMNERLFNQQLNFGREMMGSQQAFSAQQAANQMDFQRQMSNTSFQRGVSDMRAAGINPMLAVSRGGASSPSGAMGSSGIPGSGSPAAQVSPRMAAIGTASQMAQLLLSLENMKATNQEIASRTALNMAGVPKLEQEVRTSASSAAQIDSITRRLDALSQYVDQRERTEIERLKADIRHLDTSSDLNVRLSDTEKERYRLTRGEATSVGLRLSGERSLEQARRPGTFYGDYIYPYMPDFLRGSSSAGSLSRIGR